METAKAAQEAMLWVWDIAQRTVRTLVSALPSPNRAQMPLKPWRRGGFLELQMQQSLPVEKLAMMRPQACSPSLTQHTQHLHSRLTRPTQLERRLRLLLR
jgi:hypothetical protein